MKLTILGSGTMLPTKKRFPSSFLLEVNQKKILLDCGHGTLARLTEIGIDPREIDIIFISHFHTDHLADAFPLVHANFVGNIYEQKKQKPILFIGPITLQERFKKWREIFWPEPNEEPLIEFHEGVAEKTIYDIILKTFQIIHVPWFSSVGIRLEYSGKTLVYPGDVGSSQDFSELVKNCLDADLLLIETGCEKPTPNHLTLNQIEKLHKQAKIKKTVLVHLRPIPEVEKRAEEFVKEKSNFILAQDKMILEILF